MTPAEHQAEAGAPDELAIQGATALLLQRAQVHATLATVVGWTE